MVIGAASTGAKVMTATSGPGFSLKQEGISYAAATQLPILIINVNRAGPGLGNIGPEQSDYFQATKGGGHGGYKNIVLAPNSVQEMATFPHLGFHLAFKHRNPVVILADAFVGQLKEDIVFPEITEEHYDTSWATTGASQDKRHLLPSLHLDFQDQNAYSESLMQKYENISKTEQRAESYLTQDADLIFVAYGISSRLCKQVASELRNKKGIRAGLFRPITLSPFPSNQLSDLARSRRTRRFVVVELNMGQMLYDVKLAVPNSRVSFVHKLGGMLPTLKEIEAKAIDEQQDEVIAGYA